jgi:tetratricopeptide (TPR) repeat protein
VSKSYFEAYLVQQINKLENPINWVILFMAHAYHRFNFSILEWIVGHLGLKENIHEISRDHLSATLPHLSFVRRSSSGEDFVLHDEMRRLVIKYCWPTHDSELRFRKGISTCMIEYDEREIAETKSDQVRQACTIEILYHRLYVDISDGLEYFTRNFQRTVFVGKIIFARLLFHDALAFLDQMTPAQRSDMRYFEARLLREEDTPEAALEILEELSRDTASGWFVEHQPDLLREKGRCYRRRGNLREAEQCYVQSLAIEQECGNEEMVAVLLSLLGEISRRRGQFKEALTYYEQVLPLFRKLDAPSNYANVLTRMSVVYRLQGKIEEALRRCKFGWRIRHDLFQSGKISERFIGLSINALGVIYLSAGDIGEAEKCFREAYAIYERENDRASLVVTCNRLGQAELAKNELENARNWFERARASSQLIDAEQYINSLNKLGRIAILQNRLDEAIPLLDEAISYATQTFDNYQLVECLIDLARIFIQQDKVEQALQHLRQAEDVALRETYFQLLGTIEYRRGDIAYKAGAYEEAFQHFVLSCHHMTNFNDTEYSIAIRKVLDALLGIPRDKVPGIIQVLKIYWKEHGLEKRYPELLSACEEMDNLAFP